MNELINIFDDTLFRTLSADIPTLKEFVNSIKPKQIIPIHTFLGDQYKNIFDYPILELADGQVLKI